MAQRPSERRTEQRIDVDLSATLTADGTSRTCRILNICSNGFLLEAEQHIGVGEIVELRACLTPDQAITCTVQIKHVNASRRGAMVLRMGDADMSRYRRFIEEERASQMEARARARGG
jgi:hypothetical protein